MKKNMIINIATTAFITLTIGMLIGYIFATKTASLCWIDDGIYSIQHGAMVDWYEYDGTVEDLVRN